MEAEAEKNYFTIYLGEGDSGTIRVISNDREFLISQSKKNPGSLDVTLVHEAWHQTETLPTGSGLFIPVAK